MGRRKKKSKKRKRHEPAPAREPAPAPNGQGAKPSTSPFVLAIPLVVGAALVAAFLWLSPAEESDRPSLAVEPISVSSRPGANVLLITVDTLRADRLGSYGFPSGLTPNLDRLAAEGVRFERVFAHVPMTLPSHASLLTALYPYEHGVRDNGAFRLDEDVPTMASLLKGAGYETAAFVAAYVLDGRFGLDRGFDVYDDAHEDDRAVSSFEQVERPADAVASLAIDWIRTREETPWLAWLHLFDPHTPYRAPADFRDRFPDDPYGAEVAFVDHVIGTFVDELREAGKLERTFVLVLGDHGESLGDHGEQTHGTFAYNSTLHVPWILWADEGLEPSVFPARVRHIDVLPTVLDLVEVAPPEGFAGQSLLPFLRGERDYEEPLVYFEALNAHLTSDWAPLHGLVRDGFKYIALPIPELYDLSSDPEETDNLYSKEAERAFELSRELESLLEGRAIAAGTAPDEETVANLRALGYVSTPTARRRTDYTVNDDPKRLIGVSNVYDEASDLFSEGRPEEALAALRGIVEQDPRASRAYEGVAHALRDMGRHEDAVAILEQAIENGVDDAAVVGLLGTYLFEAGRVSDAAVLLEDLVRREPHQIQAYHYLGIIYGQQGRFDDAERAFEQVLSVDPRSVSTHNNLATLALSRGRFDEAADWLERVLQIDPQSASAHNRIAVVHARRGNGEAAIASWRRAVELNPGHFDALYNLAMALYERSPADARPYLERFVREAPAERYADDLSRARELVGASPESNRE